MEDGLDREINEEERFDKELSRILIDSHRNNIDCRQLLREKAADTADSYRKGRALSTLATACVLQGDVEGAEAALLEQLALDPRSPVYGMHLACFYAFEAKEYQRALDLAQQVSEGDFDREGLIRYIHGERIRIAIAAERPDIIEDSLRRIIAQGPKDEELRIEKDFLPRLAALGVSPELIAEYEALSLRPEEDDKVSW